MAWPMNRRTLLQAVGTIGALGLVGETPAAPRLLRRLTGAATIAEMLLLHHVDVVFGIPGAQENELWDEFKERGVQYQLTAHEFGAACMADGYARVTGKPGVMCVVPGPGVTNALTGLGEALLDSSPIIALVGDVAGGEKYRPFQVHSLDTVSLLKPVCKCVLKVETVEQIPAAIQLAFKTCQSDEPGPVAVVVPFHLLIEVAKFEPTGAEAIPLPFDSVAADKSLSLLADQKARIGIYAGLGCMNHGEALCKVATMLQAPVATSVSGKGVLNETHELAVGWGFGPHGTPTAEDAFANMNTLLAIGVKFSEVSTGYYGNPKIARVIHVDANAKNLNQVVATDVCVHADAGLYLAKLLESCDLLQRKKNTKLIEQIAAGKCAQAKLAAKATVNKHGIDPLAVIVSLRKSLCDDAVLFTDVSLSEHLAAEFYTVTHPRTYFNPVDNQSMGWSLPAAIGALRANPCRTVATLIGDGCLMMSMMELATAARAKLPVKVFVLDDHAYHYMQELQDSAYRRTTATYLPKLEYRSLAHGLGVAYAEATKFDQLDSVIKGALLHPGPVLVRIAADYGDRKIRWIESVRKRFTKDLTPAQKTRFLSRIAARELSLKPEKND
jgi:acetolactate synthase I/II/III large subunit